ncbi:hypothetical protein BJP74_24460 (plasmid) [Mycobacterium avium subsp. hominissuis]|uniref:hypothetical protein n=1 Tax=Mycobacterium avium TaxID=1764 RepID=UPI001C6A6C72|nr:hypothetical protein [Mycobacterium avium]QWY63731.1 hypothetical protein BJP74_24460 [Mycobacterium avium subsp. hominissuis]
MSAALATRWPQVFGAAEIEFKTSIFFCAVYREILPLLRGGGPPIFQIAGGVLPVASGFHRLLGIETIGAVVVRHVPGSTWAMSPWLERDHVMGDWMPIPQ